jgi:hypothetical protein
MVDALVHQKVIEIAQRVAAEQSWPWLEPVDVSLSFSGPGNRIWSIRTNAQSHGMNIQLSIRESDLAVLKAAFLPR